jgi:hypothetical protein
VHVHVRIQNDRQVASIETKLTLLVDGKTRVLPAYYSENYVSFAARGKPRNCNRRAENGGVGHFGSRRSRLESGRANPQCGGEMTRALRPVGRQCKVRGHS